MTLPTVLFIAGILHFCQLPAMFIAPYMLHWQEDLAKLSTMNRRIVKVLGLSIMYIVLFSGVIVIWAAEELTNGSRLSIGFTAFLAILFLFRGIVQWTLYAKVWPRGMLGRFSHVGLGILFFALSATYFFALAANLNLV